MEGLKKIFALAVCIVLVLSFLLSVSFVSHGSFHECLGEDCRICVVIQKCAETLRELLAVGGIIAFFGIAFFALSHNEEEFGQSFVSVTPVRLKVKLSD